MLKVVVSYIFVFFSMYIYILLFKKISNATPFNGLYKYLILSISCVIVMLGNLLINSIFKVLLTYLCIYMSCICFYKVSIKDALYYCIVLCLSSIIIEFFLSKGLILIFKNVNELNDSLYVKSLFSLLMILLTYFLFCIKKFSSFINFIYDETFKKRKNLFIILIEILIIYVFLRNYSNNYGDDIYYLYAVIILFIFSLSMFLFKNIYNQKLLKVQNEYLLGNIKYYEKFCDDYDELRHNLKADFLALKSVANIETQKIIDEKLKKYFKNYEDISHINNIPKGLQGIITLKLNETKNKSINMNINCDVKHDLLTNLNVKDYSLLCDFLVIFLDNAIEASEKSDEKIILVILKEYDKYLYIKIINTFNDIIDIDRIGERKYSTKNIKSGLGLNYISRHKRNNICIKKEIINNLFIVSLRVPIS